MTKAALVDQVAATVHVSKSQTDAVLTQCVQAIMEALQAGESVELRGFLPASTPLPPGAGWTEPPHGGNDPDPGESRSHLYRGEGFPGTGVTPRCGGGTA
jgi:Bacterial DNA-binding protein